ncbi:uncharacterized protein [Branchiostoma lanceolatum]|uniref:uncharacterized protein n=1 Tax=Branchiostoma lanceolatum TaxID=7740 RepID=UPI0034563D76
MTSERVSHHVLSIFGELMSLVHGRVPFITYAAVFHQRMTLTTPPDMLRMILKKLDVSRDATGYLPLWVGSMTFNLFIRVLALPFYWYNFVLLILPQMDEIKRCGYYRLYILFFVCQPCGHLWNVIVWFNGFRSLKRHLINRKTKGN